MIAKQLKITVENHLIKSIEENSDSVIIIDLDNNKTYNYPDKYVLAGLVDSHAHIWGLGMLLYDPNFVGVTSAEKCVEIAKTYKPNRGNWYFGRGWNNELWNNNNFPDKKLLDIVFPDNPVFFWRIDGHAAWVNSKALEMAEIYRFTKDPDGGQILRDDCGNPNGILVDNAATQVEKIIPYYAKDRLKLMIKGALAECREAGITGVHDMDVNPIQIEVFKELDDAGELELYVTSYLSGQNDDYIEAGYTKPYQGIKYRTKGIKFFADGALGSRGAGLLEPYSDMPSSNGLLLMGEDELYSKAKKAIEYGFDVATHAIGDAATRLVLNVYDKLRKENIASDDTILRIEHAQTVHPDDLKRFADLNIQAAVQPIHCTSDAEMALERLGEARCKSSAYPWKSLLELGVNISGSSDFPIEPFDPFIGIKSFVERKSLRTGKEFFTEEIISLEEAIISYTESCGKIEGKANSGKLEIGSEARFTILDKQIEETLDIKELNPEILIL